MTIDWEDRHKNFARVRHLLENTDLSGGDLIVLPELFDSGFSLNTQSTHDDQGQTLDFLAGLARETACTVQGGRTVRGDRERAHNRAPVLDPHGDLLAEYTKIHPFSFGREPEAFEGGDRLVFYTWNTLTCCPAICYDLRFPELFRRAALAGAELFTIGANWPSPRTAHWRALAIARAIENQAFVLDVNRVGPDTHLEYSGNSLIVGPTGDILAEGDDRERVLSAEIDPAAVRDWRRTFPALRDIRLMKSD